MQYNLTRTYPNETGRTQQCAQFVIFSYAKELAGASFDKKHQGQFSEAGFSDLFGVYRGRAVYVEIKSETGKATLHQVKFIQEKLKAGACAGFALSIADFLDICNGGFGCAVKIKGMRGQKWTRTDYEEAKSVGKNF